MEKIFYQICAAFIRNKEKRRIFRQKYVSPLKHYTGSKQVGQIVIPENLAYIERDLNRIIQTNLSTFALHQKTFSRFKNIYHGKDIVIIATGPSLKEYVPIDNVITIGVNHAYKDNRLNLNYLFIQDYLGFKSGLKEINEYQKKSCVKFYGLTTEYEPDYVRVIPESDAISANALRYRTDWANIPYFEPKFAYDISTQPLGCFGSIVFPALQFALYTNPRKIYLVGCDCTKNGHFDGTSSLDLTILLNPWIKFKSFAKVYYPATEIISINPVGLKGLFKDVYQNKEKKNETQ